MPTTVVIYVGGRGCGRALSSGQGGAPCLDNCRGNTVWGHNESGMFHCIVLVLDRSRIFGSGGAVPSPKVVVACPTSPYLLVPAVWHGT